LHVPGEPPPRTTERSPRRPLLAERPPGTSSSSGPAGEAPEDGQGEAAVVASSAGAALWSRSSRSCSARIMRALLLHPVQVPGPLREAALSLPRHDLSEQAPAVVVGQPARVLAHMGGDRVGGPGEQKPDLFVVVGLEHPGSDHANTARATRSCVARTSGSPASIRPSGAYSTVPLQPSTNSAASLMRRVSSVIWLLTFRAWCRGGRQLMTPAVCRLYEVRAGGRADRRARDVW
jgi:hypothetical protein